MPVCVVTRAPASPEFCTDSTSSISPSVRASAFGSLAVAMMSRSLTESARRRSEPATSTRSLAGCARRAASTSSAIGIAFESTTRGAGPPAASWSASVCLSCSCDLQPEALQILDRARLDGRAQRVERVDAELVVELAGALGPEARAGA